MTDRPWKIPLTPSKDQRHVADFLGLGPDSGARPRGMPRAPRVEGPPGVEGPVHSKIPEIDRLYQVQTNLQRLDTALRELEKEIEDGTPADDEARRVRRQLDNSYRTLRTWLKDHG